MINICMLVSNRGFDDPRVCMEARALAGATDADGRPVYCVHVIGWDREIDRDAVQEQDGVTFLRLALRSTHARGLSQAYFLLRFWQRAAAALRQLRPDVIHCHDLDTLPPGRRLARDLGARLVFDAHENYPDMMIGHLPRVAIAYLRRLERKLIARCDLLITVGQRLAGHYRDLGARRVALVGNWKDSAAYRFSARQIAAAREELGIDGTVAISFVANLGRERHLEPLLAAVAADARFSGVIGGEGVLAPLAAAYASKHANIKYLGHVPPSRVPLITAACDIVYYGFDRGNPNSRWSAPNKLYDAIAAGRPILAGDFGEVGLTVKSHGCGVLADTSIAAAVSEALRQFSHPAAVQRMAAAARQLQSQFSAAAATATLRAEYRAMTASDDLLSQTQLQPGEATGQAVSLATEKERH